MLYSSRNGANMPIYIIVKEMFFEKKQIHSLVESFHIGSCYTHFFTLAKQCQLTYQTNVQQQQNKFPLLITKNNHSQSIFVNWKPP